MSCLVYIGKNMVRLLKKRIKAGEKHAYKNLKDLDYQPDQLQPDELPPDQLVLEISRSYKK